MTSGITQRWRDLPQHRRASGINIKWIGSDDVVWDIGGWNEGAQGAIITGPVQGMVHVPFKGIWHEPAYAAPRFERTVDERKEISFPITLMSDYEYGWLDTESRWWNGMGRENPGWFCIFTRRFGEVFIPAQLAESVDDEFEEDPTNNDNNSHEWHIKLAVPDGDPNFRIHDLRPQEWLVKNGDPQVSIKRDDNLFAPNINVRMAKLRVANMSPTIASWPIYHVTAPGRCWLPDGLSGRMIRVPQLFPGEHVLIDTDPAHRIAISAKDPVDNWVLNILSNIDLLKFLGIDLGQEQTESVLERFHGQGFTQPIPPNTVATLPVYHSQVGARVSVHLPQRFERPFS